jgi:hypothetical protein
MDGNRKKKYIYLFNQLGNCRGNNITSKELLAKPGEKGVQREY